jgi:hypothetical protein
MSSAELTVWARVENLDRRAIQRALWDDRTLVKTWAMRGTLHVLPADELPLWHAALSTSARYRKAALWLKYFGITLDELDRITEAAGAALEGRVMTREELMKEVKRLTGSAGLSAKISQSSWGTILKPAAFTGRLCFGPSIGQRVRSPAVSWPRTVRPPTATLRAGGVAVASPPLGNGSPHLAMKCLQSTWRARGPGCSPPTPASYGSFHRSVLSGCYPVSIST